MKSRKWLVLLLVLGELARAAGPPWEPHCAFRDAVPQRLEYREPKAIVDEVIKAPANVAVEQLRGLSTSKFSQVAYDLQRRAFDEKTGPLLAALTRDNPSRMAEALRYLKEFNFSFSAHEGTGGARILYQVDAPTRDAVLTELAKSDKPYAENIRKQLDAISKPPYATIDLPRSTTDLPPPTGVTRPEAPLGPGTKIREALQHEYAMGQENDARYLCTRGVSMCVVVTLYDRKTKTGQIVHLDDNTNLPATFDHMLADLRAHGLNPKDFEARIVGGTQGNAFSAKMALGTRQRLGLEGIRVVETDVLLGKDLQGVALDLKDGSLLRDARRPQPSVDEQARITRLRTTFSPAAPSLTSSQPRIVPGP